MARSALVFIVTLLIASLSHAKTLNFTIAPSDAKHMEVIKDAASVLASVCPTVMEDYVESVNATYESDFVTRYEPKNPNAAWWEQEDDLTKPYQVKGQLGYRSEKYNWTYDVQFIVKESATGHTHYLYLGGIDEKINSLVVLGKQESLDFCEIQATMSGHYYLPLEVDYN